MFIFLHPNLAGRNEKDSHCAPGIHAGRGRAGKSSTGSRLGSRVLLMAPAVRIKNDSP